VSARGVVVGEPERQRCRRDANESAVQANLATGDGAGRLPLGCKGGDAARVAQVAPTPAEHERGRAWGGRVSYGSNTGTRRAPSSRAGGERFAVIDVVAPETRREMIDTDLRRDRIAGEPHRAPGIDLSSPEERSSR